MNPRSTQLLLPVLLLALAAGSAAGEEKQKLYRWVDKQGQVHYGDSVPAEYAERYRAWRERFCPLDDGQASARLIERLFPG